MEEKPGKKQLLFVVLSIASLVFGTKAIAPALADIAKAFPDKSTQTGQQRLIALLVDSAAVALYDADRIVPSEQLGHILIPKNVFRLDLRARQDRQTGRDNPDQRLSGHSVELESEVYLRVRRFLIPHVLLSQFNVFRRDVLMGAEGHAGLQLMRISPGHILLLPPVQ